MSLETSMFHQGQKLLIRPHDQRDCESLAHAGQICIFQRYSSGIMLRMVVVQSEDGKRLYLREEDVVPALAQLQHDWEQGFGLAFEGEPWTQYRDRRLKTTEVAS